MSKDAKDPKDYMWDAGQTARLVHKDELSREAKDAVRQDSDIADLGNGWYALVIPEEPQLEEILDDLAEEEVNTDPDEEDDGEPEVVVEEGKKPEDPMAVHNQLEKMTIPQLREMADNLGVDVHDIKLKAGLVDRIEQHLNQAK